MITHNSIIQGDCLPLLKQLPDESIDMVLTDPPYNIEKQYDTYKDKLTNKQYWAWIEEVWSELYRVLKPKCHLTFTCSQKQIWEFRPRLEKMGFMFRHVGVWHNPRRKAGSYPGQWPFAWEPVMDFTKGGFRKLNNKNSVGYMDVWVEEPPKVKHPAARPFNCWVQLIDLCSDKGDVILDPFMGSGTTPLACQLTGRKYIAFELSEKYVEMANQRLQLSCLREEKNAD